MNEQLERGKDWLEKLLQLMGVPAQVATSIKQEGDAEENWLIVEAANLTSEQVQTLIGEQGSNLDAMQYLANTLLNLGIETDLQRPLTIELDNYRVHRQAELVAQIESVVQQVRDTGEEYEMIALSSAERRQVHKMLQESEDLETESRGQEPNRRLIVRLR